MKGRNNRRNRHHQTPRKMKNKDYINRNRLNLAVNYSLWAIESMERNTSRPSYILRKDLMMDYAILDAVRHVGPRRREEMAHNVGDLGAAYEHHVSMIKNLMRKISEQEEEE